MKTTTIIFEHENDIDIHELLCKAIHERDDKSIDALNNNVCDIIDANDKIE